MSREVSPRFRHYQKTAQARAQGKDLPWDDSGWQEEIKAAKHRVAEHEAKSVKPGAEPSPPGRLT